MVNQALPSKEILSLIKLISFFKQLRHKDTLERAGFYFVNDLYNISPYEQCVFWTCEEKKITLVSASGQMDINEQGTYAQLLIKVLKQSIDTKALKSQSAIHEFVEENGYAQVHLDIDSGVSRLLSEEGYQSKKDHTACIFLYDESKLIGGLLITRDKPLGDIEKALLEDVSDALATKLIYFNKQNKKPLTFIKTSSKFRRYILIGLICLCLFPVRFSITAYSEVVPKISEVVTIPYNALITEVYVSPNQKVKEGEPLFSLDKIQLKNQYEQALQELQTAKQKLSKTERQVFADATKSAELNILREIVKSKTLESKYAKERLDLADVKSPREGIVLFSDRNDLIGKPINVGDGVMVVAADDGVELLTKIPASNMININPEVPIKFFLNTSPLKSHKAIIKTVSYQPLQDGNGELNYRARADILNPGDIERVGLTGTAKVYGSRTIFIFNLLRRPFIALRNILNF